MTGSQYTSQNRVCLCTSIRSITPCCLAGDHGRSQHSLRLIVCRIQPIYVQEAQQMLPMFPQPLGKPGIVRIGKASAFVDQLVQPLFQCCGSLFKRLPTGPASQLSVPGRPEARRSRFAQIVPRRGSYLPRSRSSSSASAPHIFASASLSAL